MKTGKSCKSTWRNWPDFAPFLLTLCLALWIPVAHAATLRQDKIRIAKYPSYNRVQLELDQAVDVRVADGMDHNGYFFVDLYGAKADFSDKVIPVRDGILKAIQTVSYPQNRVLRLVFYPQAKTRFRVVDSTNGYQYPSSPINAQKFVSSQNKSRRIIIDTSRNRQTSLPPFQQRARRSRSGPIRIIVDPGHGGKDPGAVGRHGGRTLQEKDIVLAIARQVKAILESQTEVEVLLTRNSDKYMSLSQRVRFAEEQGGDLFISLHTNAARYHRRRAQPRGLEIYALGKSSNPNIMALVEAENQEAGDDLDSASSDHLSLILKNMAQETLQDQQNWGKEAARIFHEAFMEDDYFQRYDRGVKQARFKVLYNRIMPSILVEAGFIDHPVEGRNLNTAAFQRRIAERIAKACLQWLEKAPQVFI